MLEMGLATPWAYTASAGFHILVSSANAKAIARLPFVHSIRLRPPADKLDPELRENVEQRICNGTQNGVVASATLHVILVPPAPSAADDTPRVAMRLGSGLRRALGAGVTARAVTAGKLAIDVQPASRERAAAAWLAQRGRVAWVERGGERRFAPQNRAAGKLLLSGPDEHVRLAAAFATTAAQLDGAGQVRRPRARARAANARRALSLVGCESPCMPRKWAIAG